MLKVRRRERERERYVCCEAKAEEKKGIKLNPGKLKQVREMERERCVRM